MAVTLSVYHRINRSVNWHKHNFKNISFHTSKYEMKNDDMPLNFKLGAAGCSHLEEA